MMITHLGALEISGRTGTGNAVDGWREAYARTTGSPIPTVLTTTSLMSHNDRPNMGDVEELTCANFGRLRKSLREREGQVIHAHSAFAPSVTIALEGFRLPYVHSPHGGYDPRSIARRRRRMKHLALRTFEGRMLAQAAGHIVLTTMEADQLMALGIDQRKISVVPHALTDDYEARIVHNGAIGGVEDGPVILLGRADPSNKGLDRLCDLAEKLPHWRFAAYLTPWQGLDYRAVERMLEPPENLTFNHPVFGTAKDTLLRNAGAYICTSRWEAYSASVVESMSYGLPVIISPESALAPELHDANAALVSLEHEKVDEFLASLSLRAKLASNANAWLLSTRSAPQIGEALRETYLLALRA